MAALVRSRTSGWDVLLALAILAFGLIAASHYDRAAPAPIYALATLVTFPLLVRCLFPVPVLAVVVAVTAAAGLSYTRGRWPVDAIVALYTVAAYSVADIAQGRSSRAGRADRPDRLPGRLRRARSGGTSGRRNVDTGGSFQ